MKEKWQVASQKSTEEKNKKLGKFACKGLK